MNKKNKNQKKHLIIVLVIIFAISTTIGIILLTNISKYIELIIPVSQNRVVNGFLRNEDKLVEIADYLEKLEYCEIYITSTSEKGTMFASKDVLEVGQNLQIEDDNMAKKIYDLMDHYRYNVIYKEENGIYFQRWANLDLGRGIVYSIDGKEPTNELLTIIEPVGKENWFYYEGK